MKKRTLEQILESERLCRNELGDFGINACRDSIIFTKTHLGRDYYEQLKEYVLRANTEMFFNSAMILACWELINE